MPLPAAFQLCGFRHIPWSLSLCPYQEMKLKRTQVILRICEFYMLWFGPQVDPKGRELKAWLAAQVTIRKWGKL